MSTVIREKIPRLERPSTSKHTSRESSFTLDNVLHQINKNNKDGKNSQSARLFAEKVMGDCPSWKAVTTNNENIKYLNSLKTTEDYTANDHVKLDVFQSMCKVRQTHPPNVPIQNLCPKFEDYVNYFPNL